MLGLLYTYRLGRGPREEAMLVFPETTGELKLLTAAFWMQEDLKRLTAAFC